MNLLTSVQYSILLAVGLANVCFAQDMQPAHFGEHKDAFVNSIDFPDLPDDLMIVLNCVGVLSERGRFVVGTLPFCFIDYNYTGEIDQDLTIAMGESVIKAAQNLRINPAFSEGRRRQVWFSFHVSIDNTEDNLKVSVNENHLYNKSNYGTDYISAQRYVTRGSPGHAQTGNCNSFRRDYFMLVATTVSELGQSGEVAIVNLQVDDNCLKLFKSKYARSKFIPAFFEGKPVPSLYIEPFYDQAGL